MKKRKIKLFASVASLAMVAAVMGVGVWAATTQAVQVSSTVAFSSKAIAADVALKISGVEGAQKGIINAAALTAEAVAGAGTDLTTSTKIASWGLEDTADTIATNQVKVNVDLKDGNENAVIDQGATITYEFTITPNTAANTSAMYYSVKWNQDLAAEATFSVAMFIGEDAVGEGKYVATNSGAAQGTTDEVTVKIVYTATATITNLDEADNFGTIDIKLGALATDVDQAQA